MTDPGDPGHVTGHNTLEDSIRAQASRFGVTVTLTGPFSVGAPNHIGVHNLEIAAIQKIADAGGVTVTLPDTAELNDTGHTSDHDLMTAAVAALAAAPVRPTTAPVLQYLGVGTTGLGTFRIVDYSTAEWTYAVTGPGTLNGDILTVTPTTGSAGVYATNAAGSGPTRTAYRQQWTQTSVPYTQCYNPCGDCRTDTNPNTWSCGCGSGCNDSGGGQWGACVCRGPGYTYADNYSGAGYQWSGTDYTNGQGEWWKIA